MHIVSTLIVNSITCSVFADIIIAHLWNHLRKLTTCETVERLWFTGCSGCAAARRPRRSSAVLPRRRGAKRGGGRARLVWRPETTAALRGARAAAAARAGARAQCAGRADRAVGSCRAPRLPSVSCQVSWWPRAGLARWTTLVWSWGLSSAPFALLKPRCFLYSVLALPSWINLPLLQPYT